MVHYILFSFFLLAIPLTCELRYKNGWKFGFWICVISLLILAALRGESVGNDTEEYIGIFETYKNTPDADTRYEIGYVWLNKLLSNVSQNSQIVIIVTSIFIFISYGSFIYKYCKMPNLSLFIFFTFGYYAFAISGIRQSLAIAILLFGYKYIIKGNFFKFLICVIIASLFHSTAVLFLPAYFTRNLRCNSKNLLIILLAGVGGMIAFSAITSIMFQYFIIYEHYSEGIYGGETRMASILYVVVSLLITIIGYMVYERKINKVYNSHPKKNRKTIDIEGNMIILVAIATAIYIMSLNLNIFDRIALYYNVFAMIVLPNAIYKFRPKNRLLCTAITIIFFFSYTALVILKRPLWNSSFPYTFFF